MNLIIKYDVCVFLLCVLGRKAFVRIRLAGVHKINKTSLIMKLVNTAGAPILQVDLTEDSASNKSYTTSFIPPSTPFRFQLSGQTKEGFTFQRVTHKTIQANSAVLRVIPGTDDLKLQLGKTSLVMFKLFNVGPSERFKIGVRDDKGFLKFSLVKFTKQNRQRTIVVSIRPTGKGYNKGKTDRVTATVQGESSKVILSVVVPMQMG